MNYKDFYYWIDGFMTNRSWTTIKQTDIEIIKEKMKEVNEFNNFEDTHNWEYNNVNGY
jgi:hypothetical protein